MLELTHRIPPNFRDHLYHQPPSGHFRVYQATQLRTDGVHCRESAGTGLVVLDVVPVTGYAFSSVAMSQFLCVSLFLHPQPIRGENVKTFLKKNQNAPRSSEHPPVRGKMSKRFYTVCCIDSINSINSAGYRRAGNVVYER